MRSMAFKSVCWLAAGLLMTACASTTPTASRASSLASTPTPSPASILPAPTGDESVGVRDLAPVAEGYAVRVWYPATDGSGVAGTPYMSDAAWAALGTEGLWRPATRSGAPVLPRLRTTAATDAKPASGGAPRPVVVLTPGFTWPAASLTVLAADLTSHGYIVFTIDPPPGTEPVGSGDATMGARWAARMAAIHATLKSVGEPALAEQVGSMDKDRVAVGGHSFGGIVAFDASLNEFGVSAVFDLDGGLGYSPWGARPVSVPALVIKSEIGIPWAFPHDPVEMALLRGSGQLTTVGIRGSGHCDLGDGPIVYLAADVKPESELAWCYGTIGAGGPTSAALIVRHFLNSAIGPSSTLPTAADLIKDVPSGYGDPLGLGH